MPVNSVCGASPEVLAALGGLGSVSTSASPLREACAQLGEKLYCPQLHPALSTLSSSSGRVA